MPPKTVDTAPTSHAPAQLSTPKATAKPSAKPEDLELGRKREEQAAVEAELAECELRATNLRAELVAFERQYLHVVGSRYAELDELKAQLAELLASRHPDDLRAQEAARQSRARAAETKSGAGEKSQDEPRAFKASPEMKRVYREVAKRIHPDLTTDRNDRNARQQLMARANEAYERGDEPALTRILTEYESSPEAIQGEGPGAELIRVIRRISQVRGRLAEIEAESQALLGSDLHQLRARVEEAGQHGRDALQEIVARADEKIAEVKQRIEHEKHKGRPA